MSDAQLKDAVPSPLKLREMLEEMAIKELLGPVGGEEEEVDERIRDRYLVGILAPRQRAEETSRTKAAIPTAEQAEATTTSRATFHPATNWPLKGSEKAV